MEKPFDVSFCDRHNRTIETIRVYAENAEDAESYAWDIFESKYVFVDTEEVK